MISVKREGYFGRDIPESAFRRFFRHGGRAGPEEPGKVEEWSVMAEDDPGIVTINVIVPPLNDAVYWGDGKGTLVALEYRFGDEFGIFSPGWTDLGAQAWGQTIDLVVRAVNEAGPGEWSDPISVAIAGQPITAPEITTARLAPLPMAVDQPVVCLLEWTGSSDGEEITYEWFVNDVAQPAAGNVFTPSLAGQRIYCRVTVTNSAGSATASTAASFVSGNDPVDFGGFPYDLPLSVGT